MSFIICNIPKYKGILLDIVIYIILNVSFKQIKLKLNLQLFQRIFADFCLKITKLNKCMKFLFNFWHKKTRLVVAFFSSFRYFLYNYIIGIFEKY